MAHSCMTVPAIEAELDRILAIEWWESERPRLDDLCEMLGAVEHPDADLGHLKSEISQTLQLAGPDDIAVLVRAGADVNFADVFGKTALHYARRPLSAMKLIEAGADVAAVDLAGNSALHSAVSQNNGFLLRRLAELGVPDAANNQGQRFHDLFVGSCEVAGRRSAVSSAQLHASLADRLYWEVDVRVVDLVPPAANDDSEQELTYWMGDARFYMEEVHLWTDRRVGDWRDLLAETIEWNDPLAPASEYCGMYFGSHARLAESKLSFSSPGATSCHARWEGSLGGELGIESFVVDCEMTFLGVICQDDSPETNVMLNHYFTEAEWRFESWSRGRCLAVMT